MSTIISLLVRLLLRCLHVGPNNTSTGLRLTAWPTAGIILTTTQEQKEVETVKMYEYNKVPCGCEVILHIKCTCIYWGSHTRKAWSTNVAKMKFIFTSSVISGSSSWPHPTPPTDPSLTCHSPHYRVPGQGWWRAAKQGSGCSWSPQSCGRWWTWRHTRDVSCLWWWAVIFC